MSERPSGHEHVLEAMAAEPAATRREDRPVSLRRLLDGVRRVCGVDLPLRTREYRQALLLLESHQRAQQGLFAHDVAAERSLRERAEASESAIRRALDFKDALIVDANHRVKNTLQMAASLLSVHARATDCAEIRSALQQSLNRLLVLARTHELLSAPVDGTQAIPMPQLLHAVGDTLRQSFSEVSARVELRITSEPIVLPAGDATAVALLANEVVTNAHKHAFPGAAVGEITVDLHRARAGAFVLRIEDSGVGMGSGNDAKGGLGLQLIRAFTAQLRGTLVVAARPDTTGTAMMLTLPPPQDVVSR